MVLPELRALASQVGVKGTSGMRKSDLIEAIRERQGGGARNGGGSRNNPPRADDPPAESNQPSRSRPRTPNRLRKPGRRGRTRAVGGKQPGRQEPSGESAEQRRSSVPPATAASVPPATAASPARARTRPASPVIRAATVRRIVMTTAARAGWPARTAFP